MVGVVRRRTVFTWLVCSSLAACAGAPTLATYEGRDTRGSMVMGTWTRSYIVHVPTRTTVGPLAPLIIVFHGLGQSATQLQQQTGLDEVADRAGFIVVYPEAAIGQWDVTGDFVDTFGFDDIAFARALIQRMSDGYVINPRRIYAVGLSNGAVFAQRLACEVTDKIAGFIAVAGTLSRPARDNCFPSQPVSGLYIIGSKDTQFPVGGNSVVLSVDSTMTFWGKQNHCAERGTRATLPDTAHDGTLAYRSRFLDCIDGGAIELDSIANGGHSWPGQVNPANANAAAATSRNLSANEEIRRFVMAGRARPRFAAEAAARPRLRHRL